MLQTLLHLGSVLLYQNTGDFGYLTLSGIILAFNAVAHAFAIGVLMSPEILFEVNQREYEKQADYFSRFTLQISSLLVAYMLYLNKWQFLAGLITLQAASVAWSCLFSIYINKIVKRRGNKEQ